MKSYMPAKIFALLICIYCYHHGNKMLNYQINCLFWTFLLFFHWITLKVNGNVRIVLLHKVSTVDQHKTYFSSLYTIQPALQSKSCLSAMAKKNVLLASEHIQTHTQTHTPLSAYISWSTQGSQI